MKINNKFTFKDKALIFPLIFSFILLAVVFGIAFVIFTQNKSTSNPTTSTPTISGVSEISVTHIIPDEPQPLTSGVPHTFLVYFNQNISINEFVINLSYTDITQENPTLNSVPVSLSLLSPKVIEVKAKNPIAQQREYYLTITDSQTGQQLSQTNYLSSEIQPTSIPSNNETLKNYLPYETSSFMLEYLTNQNLYVFHFKYNPALSTSIQQQYDDAKTQAIQFIESKGVDINSIVIQYRSS